MRWTLALTLAAALTAACGSDDTDTDGTDTDGGDDGISSFDRLGAPEEYRNFWNTENGCETEDGPGVQVYWHTDDARSIDLGGGRFSFEATETWYWFNGDNSPQDCKDTFQITGQFYTSDYGLLGCDGCEEAYTFRRELVASDCNVLYHTLFGFDAEMDAPDPQVYEGFLLFDTHIEFDDSPNEDNKMLVVARYRRPDNRYSLNNNYSVPNMSRRIVDDPERQGPPGEYEWVGQACIGTGGGGGGGGV